MSVHRSVAHFAPITVNCTSGMGRVAFHWRAALMSLGWSFQHYGVDEVPLPRLKTLWPLAARRTWQSGRFRHQLLLAHEPTAEIFRSTGIPTVLFSHGLESRSKQLAPVEPGLLQSKARSKLTLPFWLWRSRQRDLGLRRCPLLLLINEDDRSYAISHYGRSPDDIFVFRNGVNPSTLVPHDILPGPSTILFYGSWLERKGKSVLVNAANQLALQGYSVRWLLVGTGLTEADVRADWPMHLQAAVEVIPHVQADTDDAVYQRATVFVLPSYFEGQPLTLLQAMESGRCVIASRTCGQKDIIKHGFNGLLFEPGNSSELAHLIALVIEDKDLCFQLGGQAKNDMKSRRWPSVSSEVAVRLQQFLDERCPLA